VYINSKNTHAPEYAFLLIIRQASEWKQRELVQVRATANQISNTHTHIHTNARTTGPPKVCHQINMPTHLTDAVFRVITESHLTSETCTHSDKLSFLCTSPEC